MSKKKIAIIGAILLVLGFTAWGIFAPKKSATQYQTTPALKDTLITSISASGTVTSGGNQAVTTTATGTVSAVYVKNGDTVVAGQEIAAISLDQDSLARSASAWSSYLSAKNNVDSAQANMNSLQATLFSTNQKLINDAVARNLTVGDPTYIQENATWLQAEDNYNNQATVINQAQASLSNAWYTYQQISPVIYAPISGVVKGLAIAPGLGLAASQKIVTISPPDSHIQAAVNLSEVDITHVKPGQKATLTLDALPNQTFTGKVLAINPNGTVSSSVTTYPVTISFDTSVDSIYPNMAVTAQIITSIKQNAILVPSSAVTTTGGESTVRILKSGQVTSVTVEVGDSNSTQTEITSGVNEGDQVITGSAASTTTRTPGSTSASPFSGLGGNRFFGGAGGR